MRAVVRLTIFTEPVGKARPRVVRGKDGKVHTFTPDKTRKAEQHIDDFIQAYLMQHDPIARELPISLEVWVYIKPPASLPKRKFGRVYPTTRPDWDNYGKLVSDAVQGVWGDDAQVVDAIVHKRYAWDGKPRWEIAIGVLDEVQEEAA